MIGKVFLLVSMLVLYCSSGGLAQTPLDFPETPLRLIAESIGEPCAICARETREKAFQLIEERFAAGKTFTTTGSCLLARTDLSEENELMLSCDLPGRESLPLISFRFHTPANHLVGISTADFTDEAIVSAYRSASPGTVFEGALRTIAFRYGVGTSFSYNTSRKVIQVHCRLLSLKRQSP
jgi:hypothetical protein